MSKKLKGYKDLVVWQKSLTLVKLDYQLARSLPADERFGPVSQMQCAAESVPSNLAEGHARNTTSEFIQFISNAEGSLAGLLTQLIVSIEPGFCAADGAQPLHRLIEEIRKMANALRRTLASCP